MARVTFLHVWTDGQEGDACPKKGGQPLRLGDGQCDDCRHYQGLGPFVTVRCGHPEARCSHEEVERKPAGSSFYALYLRLKKQFPNTVLLMRIGDFFEAFDEDARILAETCDVVLDSRLLGGERVPMAGFPYFAVERYIAELIETGHKVAVCERTDKPVKITAPPVQVPEPVTPAEEQAATIPTPGPAQMSLF